MEEVFVEAFEVWGVSEVTKNIYEVDPETSKIMACWGKFNGKYAQKCEHNNIYGIYTDYVSNENGEYMFVAASDAESLAGEKLTSVKVPAGGYHKFSFTGIIPDVVINGWEFIWDFYKKNDHKRSFEVDFEQYTPNGVDIYIGIK